MIGINILLSGIILFYFIGIILFIIASQFTNNKLKIMFLVFYGVLYAFLFYKNQKSAKEKKPGYVFLFNFSHSLNLLSMTLALIGI
jgi:uncharacterized membrane protein SirB2